MKFTTDTYLKISIVLLAIVLVLFGFILWRQYVQFTHGRTVPLHVSLDLKRHSGPLPVSSASSVQSWMTFDYIDYLFDLPPNYLKTALSITSQSYPRISISHYAALASTTPSNALIEVRQAILSYNPASQE